VPDGDVDAFAKAVAAVLDSPALWRELSERALARAATFDWDASVAGHVDVFRSVARG
jgi:glycosyltransferase involved in cell wall biosynthesis